MVLESPGKLDSFAPSCFEGISRPGQRFVKVTQIARIGHACGQDIFVGWRGDSVCSVVDGKTLDNSRHMAVEAGSLTREVVAVRTLSAYELKFLMAIYTYR